MTDRELLEAAAKAAGPQIGRHRAPPSDSSVFCSNGLYLNPLADDGDALRLAVELRNDVTFSDALVMTWPVDGRDGESEPLNPCPYAATRRAIVLAAAAMGGAK